MRIACMVVWLLACGVNDATPPAKREVLSEPPLAHAAVGEIASLPPELRRAFEVHGDFELMQRPEPGDWLAEHPERPQTFGGFLQATTNVPAGERRIIYLLPLGAFPKTAPPLAQLQAVVTAYFQLEVKRLPAVPLSELRVKTRVHGKRQLLAPDVLRWLTKRVPPDAFALMAITMEDLYPEASWNFVFGMASLHERVGVQSFARQDPAFFGNARGEGWQALALRRATWTLVHEIGHMFGLPHCTFYECVQAGANNQHEADRRPLHACPVCLRKLHAAIEFDPAKREEALARVLGDLGIADEAAWSARRARWIREGTVAR